MSTFEIKRPATLDVLAAPMRKTANISDCGTYRYRLTRHWDVNTLAMPFVMLNPSSADADIDDPTIRRCIGFARREGAGGIVVVNLWALRATDPKRLALYSDPHGPQNCEALDEIAITSAATGKSIICAWGTGGGERGVYVADRFARQGAHLLCLGKTSAGHPRHPLYVRSDQPLEAYP